MFSNMSSSETVCVIGAGISGLAALKCLSDAGFNVTCFESDENVGGRWHKDNKDPIPRTTITNLPKHMSCYSDFPLPEEYPIYISADQYAKYFEMYAENFCLLNLIKFQHEVLQAEPIHNSISEVVSWKVRYVNKILNEEEVQEFKYLVVSSGFYTLPYIPDKIQSVVKDFTGQIMHSLEYKDAENFKDKTVVVCGLGNTGGDIAVQTSRFAKKTIVSTSHGTYIVGRFVDYGNIPLTSSLTRIAGYLPSFLISIVRNNFLSRITNHVADINQWNVAPKSKMSIIINDEILHQIAFGKIEKRSGIEKIEGNTFYFNDGKVVENVDVIVLCTGYARKFSFLDEKVISPQRNGKFVPLYKAIFPINYHESLAFVGIFSVLNTYTLTAEIQSRYIAEMFKGNIKLPSKDQMKQEIDQHIKNLEDKFESNVKELNMILEPWKYYNDLCGEIGCRPSLFKILFTDPFLFWHLSTKYNFHEFRLSGPNKWNGAREAIINQDKSIYSFFTR